MEMGVFPGMLLLLLLLLQGIRLLATNITDQVTRLGPNVLLTSSSVGGIIHELLQVLTLRMSVFV
jgi:hypothetical protein